MVTMDNRIRKIETDTNLIRVNHEDGAIASVNCDFNESNSWTVTSVIQRRMDGSVDFYRGWEEYKKGFGNPDGELWLGLDKLHRMTSRKNYSLRIDLLNWEGERRYAAYSTFRIGDKDSYYRLTVSGYSGNAKDGMNYHNGMSFTTHDRDNDRGSSNCAVSYHGAWWYKFCYHANLNGKYYKSSSGPGGNGVSWQLWDGDNYSLKFVEMKIKPN
uniref:ryncolin-1-like n=1 Tax=Styela clava TaxID=7725 RepID=UPI001939AEA1|nr:ryncolin-1-like [Styela clava]